MFPRFHTRLLLLLLLLLLLFAERVGSTLHPKMGETILAGPPTR